jgi:hypothetical protein
MCLKQQFFWVVVEKLYNTYYMLQYYIFYIYNDTKVENGFPIHERMGKEMKK